MNFLQEKITAPSGSTYLIPFTYNKKAYARYSISLFLRKPLVLMAALYIFAGISHFRNSDFFLKITPPWVPEPEKINLLVGAIEIILGAALFVVKFQSYAAWGIIALLIAVFPANVYHFQKALKKNKMVIPTLIRLPIQALLIYWAYSFT